MTHQYFRVVAETVNGFRVLGTRTTFEAAQKLANAYIASLDHWFDDFPEMLIETVN